MRNDLLKRLVSQDHHGSAVRELLHSDLQTRLDYLARTEPGSLWVEVAREHRRLTGLIDAMRYHLEYIEEEAKVADGNSAVRLLHINRSARQVLDLLEV